MGFKVSRGQPTTIDGAEHLTRRGETWLFPYDDKAGAPIFAAAASENRGRSQYGSSYGTTGSLAQGMQTVNNNANSGLESMAAVAAAGTFSLPAWRAQAAIPTNPNYTGLAPAVANGRIVRVPLTDLAMPRLPGVGVDESIESFVIEAMLRKIDGTLVVPNFCGFYLFHGNQGALNPAQTDPFVGLVGDGLLGFRFGSVSCPDGVLIVPAENAIDAGSIQPAGLVNPGLNWFHVKLKIIRASPSSVAVIACYLDDNLITTFTTVANMPRGRLAVATPNFGNIMPFIGTCQSIVPPPNREGLYVQWVHFYWDSDLTL